MPYSSVNSENNVLDFFPCAIYFKNYINTDIGDGLQTISTTVVVKSYEDFYFYFFTLCNCPTYDHYDDDDMTNGYISISDYEIEINGSGFCSGQSYDIARLFPLCINNIYIIDIILTIGYALLSMYCLLARSKLKLMSNYYTVLSILLYFFNL